MHDDALAMIPMPMLAIFLSMPSMFFVMVRLVMLVMPFMPMPIPPMLVFLHAHVQLYMPIYDTRFTCSLARQHRDAHPPAGVARVPGRCTSAWQQYLKQHRSQGTMAELADQWTGLTEAQKANYAPPKKPSKPRPLLPQSLRSPSHSLTHQMAFIR